jgi:putative ABC transport system permease protein
MTRFNLALRLLWRDSRSGELTVLLLALLIAVTSSTAIALFSERLQHTMGHQTAEFLAGDLAVTSSAPLPETWVEKAAQWHLQSAHTVEFSSVLIEHDDLLLASIKAVSASYPLRGALKTMLNTDAPEAVTHSVPVTGTVWVEPRILPALKLHIGDVLTVGEKPLTITRLITYEPDKQGDFYSFSPRVLMNADDLAATGVVRPGSHVHYFFQFIGETPDLKRFSQWLKPQLTPSQRLLDIHQDRPELGSALDRAERYLGLSSTLVVIIAGVAIAMTSRRYSERHFDNAALLRCLGCKQHEILWLYTSQFMVLGLLASSIGCGLGWLVQSGLFYLLKDLLPQQLAEPSLVTVAFGFVVGLAVLLGFALPPLLRLKAVSPLRVLRRELKPLPASAWLVYGLALAMIGVLVWRYTHDANLIAVLVGGGALCVGVAGLLVFALLTAGRAVLPSLSLSWRFGLQGLLGNRRASVGQILAFTVILVAMRLSFSVRNDLLDDWQQQLPAQAPNHFALNIFPAQRAAFGQDLQQQQIAVSPFFPVVRGRLVAINATPVQKIASKNGSTQGDNATRRELGLTWTQDLPAENILTAGHWWTNPPAGLVSVEQKLAENLHITVGDTLTFTIGDQQLNARVASLRALRWDTMKPNFYMIFSPGTLDAYPATYLTSFYVAKGQKNVLNSLVKSYPNTTIMDVDAILQQLKTIVVQLTQAINYLLYFALMAGFTVVFATVYTTLDSRIYEGALLRTLGANRRLLRTSQRVEFGTLGFLAGGLAALISEAIIAILYTHVMHMAYHPTLYLWLLMPLMGASCIGLAGCWGLRGVLDKAPLQVLRAL